MCCCRQEGRRRTRGVWQRCVGAVSSPTDPDARTPRHGLSLHLRRLHLGLNNQARARGVVIHGAEYFSDSVITKAWTTLQ
jgi:L,D-transpeptidase catalytic domain